MPAFKKGHRKVGGRKEGQAEKNDIVTHAIKRINIARRKWDKNAIE